MLTANPTSASTPEVGITGILDQLRTRLGAYKRREINQIATLGGIAPSQIYAFRTGGRGSRVQIDTVTRIEKGLELFEVQQAGRA